MNERATKFRKEALLPAFNQRLGSNKIKEGILNELNKIADKDQGGETAPSTRGLKRDRTKEEMDEMAAATKIPCPNKRRKIKRFEESNRNSQNGNDNLHTPEANNPLLMPNSDSPSIPYDGNLFGIDNGQTSGAMDAFESLCSQNLPQPFPQQPDLTAQQPPPWSSLYSENGVPRGQTMGSAGSQQSTWQSIIPPYQTTYPMDWETRHQGSRGPSPYSAPSPISYPQNNSYLPSQYIAQTSQPNALKRGREEEPSQGGHQCAPYQAKRQRKSAASENPEVERLRQFSQVGALRHGAQRSAQKIGPLSQTAGRASALRGQQVGSQSPSSPIHTSYVPQTPRTTTGVPSTNSAYPSDGSHSKIDLRSTSVSHPLNDTTSTTPADLTSEPEDSGITLDSAHKVHDERNGRGTTTPVQKKRKDPPQSDSPHCAKRAKTHNGLPCGEEQAHINKGKGRAETPDSEDHVEEYEASPEHNNYINKNGDGNGDDTNNGSDEEDGEDGEDDFLADMQEAITNSKQQIPPEKFGESSNSNSAVSDDHVQQMKQMMEKAKTASPKESDADANEATDVDQDSKLNPSDPQLYGGNTWQEVVDQSQLTAEMLGSSSPNAVKDLPGNDQAANNAEQQEVPPTAVPTSLSNGEHPDWAYLDQLYARIKSGQEAQLELNQIVEASARQREVSDQTATNSVTRSQAATSPQAGSEETDGATLEGRTTSDHVPSPETAKIPHLSDEETAQDLDTGHQGVPLYHSAPPQKLPISSEDETVRDLQSFNSEYLTSGPNFIHPPDSSFPGDWYPNDPSLQNLGHHTPGHPNIYTPQTHDANAAFPSGPHLRSGNVDANNSSTETGFFDPSASDSLAPADDLDETNWNSFNWDEYVGQINAGGVCTSSSAPAPTAPAAPTPTPHAPSTEEIFNNDNLDLFEDEEWFRDAEAGLKKAIEESEGDGNGGN